MDATNITQTVADGYLQALARRGIKYVFANSGTDFGPIIEAIARAKETGTRIPEFMIVPHENVAISMANGYFETCGEMAAVMVHVTVGTANALCGLMNASRENIPVLLAAGRTPITESGFPTSRNGTVHWGQESYDQGSMLREYVKWDYELRAGQPIDTVVGRALDIAMSDPKGPVYLTLPREVLANDAGNVGPMPRNRPLGMELTMPSAEAIEKAATLIAATDKVLIITSRAGRTPQGFKALADLAETHAIPVTQTTGVNLPSSHPMSLGAPSKALLEWADVIVVIDTLVPWMPSGARPRPETKLIHLGNDPMFTRIPFRGYESDVLIPGDTTGAMRMLNDALQVKLKAKGQAADKRRGMVAEMREKARARQAKMIQDVKSSRPIHPIWLAHCINQVKDKSAIVVNELGVPASFLEFESSNSTFGASGAGGLGRGLGGALGAKLAAPERQVIASVGDGAYMFGCPIAAHFVGRAQNLPTLTIVSNNAEWVAVREATLRVSPSGAASRANVMPLTSLTPSPDFEKAVESCGGIGERIEDPEKLIPALERALKHVADGKQVLLNVITEGARVGAG